VKVPLADVVAIGFATPPDPAPTWTDDDVAVDLAGGETLCADGGEYAFWFRPGDPGRVSIYFEGGGACWRGP